MINKEKSIPELYYSRHKYDSAKISYNYEDNLINNTVSPVLLKNKNNKVFLDYFKKILVFNIHSILELRNAFNHTVDKYYGDHSN